MQPISSSPSGRRICLSVISAYKAAETSRTKHAKNILSALYGRYTSCFRCSLPGVSPAVYNRQPNLTAEAHTLIYLLYTDGVFCTLHFVLPHCMRSLTIKYIYCADAECAAFLFCRAFIPRSFVQTASAKKRLLFPSDENLHIFPDFVTHKCIQKRHTAVKAVCPFQIPASRLPIGIYELSQIINP